MKTNVEVYIDSGYSRRGWFTLIASEPAFTSVGQPMPGQVTVIYKTEAGVFQKTIFNKKSKFRVKRGAK